MKIILRIAVDLLSFFLIFAMPAWLTIFLVCLAIFVFPQYYESILLAFFIDSFYGVSGSTFFGLNILFTVIVSTVFVVAILAKPRLKFY